MFLDQVMNEKRIAGRIQTSLGSKSYVNQSVYTLHGQIKLGQK
jgi:hypothetical protein